MSGRHVIVVRVEGGMVIDVENVPVGVVVEVRDWDIEGLDEGQIADLDTDEAGDPYIASRYEAEV